MTLKNKLICNATHGSGREIVCITGQSRPTCVQLDLCSPLTVKIAEGTPALLGPSLCIFETFSSFSWALKKTQQSCISAVHGHAASSHLTKGSKLAWDACIFAAPKCRCVRIAACLEGLSWYWHRVMQRKECRNSACQDK
jgi:hypothetical protein